MARGPLQAALGDTARGAPSRDGERRGSGGEERTGGDHVGSRGWAPKFGSCSVNRSCRGGAQRERGPLSEPQSGQVTQKSHPHMRLLELREITGGCGVWRMKSQDVDVHVGHCCGHCHTTAFLGVQGGHSLPSGGEGQPARTCSHAHQLPGPVATRKSGVRQGDRAWEGILGPGCQGPCHRTPPHCAAERAKLPPEKGEREKAPTVHTACVAPCQDSAVPETSPRSPCDGGEQGACHSR